MENLAEKIILQAARTPKLDAEKLNTIKRDFLRIQSGGKHIPTTAELLKSYHKLVKLNKLKSSENLERALVKRAVRTMSGVSIVTVLTKPFPCPGKCIYCPDDARMPKSYIAEEPAAARALTLKFDPYEQVKRRIETLEGNGHSADKIELIVKGGSWNAYPLNYQYWFILRCFEACNRSRAKTKLNITLANLKKLMARAQTKNESAPHRIIGLTLETRPDLITTQTTETMRALGCTRVELGVQTIDEKILKLIKRGHNARAVKNAVTLLRHYGYKVDFHLMPQLPGTTPVKDLKMMREIFSDPAYRPDMLKIYPCSVVENTELYKWFKAKKFKPYSDKKLIGVLKQFKSEVPQYVRISRLIRDIPGNHIKAGNRITNLRQMIQTQMAAENLHCRCLRCREVGHQKIDTKNLSLKLFV